MRTTGRHAEVGAAPAGRSAFRRAAPARAALEPVALDAVSLNFAVVDPVVLDPTVLDPTAPDPTALDAVALDAVALDPTALDPTALDPTALDPTALDAVAIDHEPCGREEFHPAASDLTAYDSAVSDSAVSDLEAPDREPLAPHERAGGIRAAMDAVLEDVVQLDRAAAQLAAFRTGLLAHLGVLAGLHADAEDEARRTRQPARDVAHPRAHASRDLSARSLRAELAAATRTPERTVERQLAEATALVGSYPSTCRALAAGILSERHARVILESLVVLPNAVRESVEQQAIALAAESTPSQLARRLRTLCDEAQPQSLATRHEQALERRDVTVTDLRDGMSLLEAYLPSPTAHAAHDRLTRMAAALGGQEQAARRADPEAREPRTRGQLRADVFEEVVLGAAAEGLPAAVNAIRGEVAVLVPVQTLAGYDAPATLDGVTPVDPAAARRLAGAAPSLGRILTDPESGAMLSLSRRRYRPPAELRRAVQLRDGTCRFAGCAMPAARCEIDHTVDWSASGETRLDNLMALCVGHHTLKHATPWTVRQRADGSGVAEWTSPGGRRYVSRPALRFTEREPDPDPGHGTGRDAPSLPSGIAASPERGASVPDPDPDAGTDPGAASAPGPAPPPF